MWPRQSYGRHRTKRDFRGRADDIAVGSDDARHMCAVTCDRECISAPASTRRSGQCFGKSPAPSRSQAACSTVSAGYSVACGRATRDRGWVREASTIRCESAPICARHHGTSIKRYTVVEMLWDHPHKRTVAGVTWIVVREQLEETGVKVVGTCMHSSGVTSSVLHAWSLAPLRRQQCPCPPSTS